MSQEKREWTRSIIRVGDGRGFVIGADHERFVITAGHCLPHFPPSVSFSHLEERTYAKLLGPIDGECTVWTECLFADPIADLAVLSSPDDQELWEEAVEFASLIDEAVPLPIAPLALGRSLVSTPSRLIRVNDRMTKIEEITFLGPLEWKGPAWLLSLDQRWFRCDISAGSRALWIQNAAEDIVGGMSGSPIVADDGAAIGVVCASGGTELTGHREGGPNPILERNLPAWLLDELNLNVQPTT